MSTDTVPNLKSLWKHTNGNIYQVLLVTNLPNDVCYPMTIVYQGANGAIWSRPASDWHRSMTFICETLLAEDQLRHMQELKARPVWFGTDDKTKETCKAKYTNPANWT